MPSLVAQVLHRSRLQWLLFAANHPRNWGWAFATPADNGPVSRGRRLPSSVSGWEREATAVQAGTFLDCSPQVWSTALRRAGPGQPGQKPGSSHPACQGLRASMVNDPTPALVGLNQDPQQATRAWAPVKKTTPGPTRSPPFYCSTINRRGIVRREREEAVGQAQAPIPGLSSIKGGAPFRTKWGVGQRLPYFHCKTNSSAQPPVRKVQL